MSFHWQRLVLLLLTSLLSTECLKYPLDEELIEPGQMLIPALPRPMTTSADSPFHIFAAHDPSVQVWSKIEKSQIRSSLDLVNNLHLVVFSANTEMEVPYAFLYGYRIHDSMDILFEMCKNLDMESFQAIGDIESFSTSPFVVKKREHAAYFHASVPVAKSGYQYGFVLNCNEEPLTLKEGFMKFINPHGYLPGGWYLKLPFSVFVTFGYTFATGMFLIKSCLFSDQLMFAQYGVIGVLIMGFIEQISTFFTFLQMNAHGQLPCCPVRADIGFVMVVSAIKRAAFVTFLLFISLGYGIQRPSLRRYEYTAVAITGVVYLLAAVNYELAEISDIDNSAEDNSGVPLDSKVFASLVLSTLNIIVVYWVYLSIVNVIEDLEKQEQLAKKALYESLIKTIIFWCIIGFLMEIFFYSWLTHKIATPWKYDMVPTFIWDFMYFVVVVQVGWIWLPNNTTKQFAYAVQLPTEDFEDFEVEEDETEDEIEFKKIGVDGVEDDSEKEF